MNYCNEFSNLEDPLKILELAFNKMDKHILVSTTVMILKFLTVFHPSLPPLKASFRRSFGLLKRAKIDTDRH
mgnify:CR=1 FL=1